MKATTHFAYKDGKLIFTVQVTDEAGNVLAQNVTEGSAVGALEAIIHATPTKVDDALLPYIESLAKLIPPVGA